MSSKTDDRRSLPCPHPEIGSRSFRAWRSSLRNTIARSFVNQVICAVVEISHAGGLKVLDRNQSPRVLEIVDVSRQPWVGITLTFDKYDAPWLQAHAWVLGQQGYEWQEGGSDGHMVLSRIPQSKSSAIGAEACYWLLRPSSAANVIGRNRLYALFRLVLRADVGGFFAHWFRPCFIVQREVTFLINQFRIINDLRRLSHDEHLDSIQFPSRMGEHWYLCWLRGISQPLP